MKNLKYTLILLPLFALAACSSSGGGSSGSNNSTQSIPTPEACSKIAAQTKDLHGLPAESLISVMIQKGLLTEATVPCLDQKLAIECSSESCYFQERIQQ